MTSRKLARVALILGTGVCCSVLAGVPVGTTSAQTAASRPNDPMTDISGLWLVHDPGSGDWSSFFDNVPKPSILPEIQKMNDEDTARLNAGNVVSTGGRGGANCPAGNLPMMMASSPPLNIVQSRMKCSLEANRAEDG